MSKWLGLELRRIREEQGLTLLEAREKTGGSRRKLSELERGLTCSPKTGPATMRVQQPTMGTRRTLYGQKTLTRADSAQAAPSRSEARFRFHGVGSEQGAGYKPSQLPPLEEPVWRDEHQRSEAPQG